MIAVATADELADAVAHAAAEADIVIMAAAVADFRAEAPADAKIKKDASTGGLVLTLVRTRDALGEVLAQPVDGRIVVGFAAETEAGREARDRVGRRRRDDHDVGATAEVDVRDRLHAVPHIGAHRIAADRLPRRHPDEAQRALGREHVHIVPLEHERAHHLHRLVRGDAAGHSDHDRELVHGT